MLYNRIITLSACNTLQYSLLHCSVVIQKVSYSVIPLFHYSKFQSLPFLEASSVLSIFPDKCSSKLSGFQIVPNWLVSSQRWANLMLVDVQLILSLGRFPVGVQQSKKRCCATSQILSFASYVCYKQEYIMEISCILYSCYELLYVCQLYFSL